METVIISPQFKITLPKSIYEKYNLKPGQKLQIFSYQNRIIIIPIKPAEELRGFFKGSDVSAKREEDRY